MTINIHPLDALKACATNTAEKVVMICGERTWTAADLLLDVNRLAAGMVLRGVRPADRIAIHMLNIAETVVSYLACFRLGAIAMPLNARFKTEELRYWVERTKPVLYLGQTELYPVFADVPEDLIASSARYIVRMDGAANGGRPWSELFVEDNARGEFANVSPDAAALLLSTSGTTGRSKLVIWTHRILSSFGPSAPGRGLNADDVLPLATPLMHGSGVYIMTAAFTHSGTIVLVPRFDPDVVLDAIEKYRCNVMVGLPFMCAALARRQDERPRDVTSLRTCGVAGDSCPPEVERSFGIHLGKPLLSFWAATEDVGAAILGSRVGPYFRLNGTAEIRIVNDDGVDVADGETGEMLLRSSTTVPGYWENPGEINRLPNGIFYSGDLVRKVGDREFQYMGRKKDLIIRGGSNISPAEVEAVLQDLPGIREAAVSGLPDEEWGQRVGALLVLEPGVVPESVPTILMAAKSKLADYKLPEAIAVTDHIPRNTLTKIDRNAVTAAIVAQNGLRSL
ncbi:hypothetical protein FHL15_009294 [Xylaria flabelliformis]|uniref:AMP-dependent synthetase/ligase domain-containing protein n=1 Tax=Xylaria flabelliformis TaxID=2512241 RepID=A0A553HPI9_9PEZI|nr:hypothetical protein FHL15_009294 [Xylaria flabelliformis]